jgi:L-rhamnose mutarotase
MVIKVKPDKFQEYKQLHAQVWPDVLKMIKECNIRNYSIYHKDGYLFSYFEYVGDDFRAEGQWWASMEEVFHCD